MNDLGVSHRKETSYPWYETIEGDFLYQGDILRDFEVLVPGSSAEGDQASGEYHKFDVVIMTQTCDIAQRKVESLLLCPCWNLWEFIEQAKKGTNWGREQREALRRGDIPGYHLTNEVDQDGLRMDITIIDFHVVYTAPTQIVRTFALKSGKRLRLLPPYREHLAQAFARFFMRVGLPVDISPEKLRTQPA
jgi:hypothetical protein